MGWKLRSLVPLVLLFCGCNDVNYANTHFKCDQGEECPPGQECIGGAVCGPRATDAPSADGRADAGIVDAGDPPDADPGGTFVYGGRVDGTVGPGDPAEDTHLSMGNNTLNYGGDVRIFLCNTCSDAEFNGDIVDGLLRFDLSAIPPGATVTAATLLINTIAGGNLGSGSVGVFEVLEPWTEGIGGRAGVTGQANWSRRDAVNNWINAGAGTPMSRDATPLVTFSPTSSSTTYPLAGQMLLDLVKIWVADSTTNHGLALVITSGTSDVEFASSEATNAATRPGLRVTYGP